MKIELGCLQAWFRWMCLLLAASGWLAAAGCRPQARSIETDSQEALKPSPEALAESAKNELFQRLSGRLTEVLQSQGPVAAIDVCSKEASKIAAEVGRELGVQIGRTSLKLRNQEIVPPSWAARWIQQGISEVHIETLPAGTGALFPIQLQAKCTMCHGPKQQISGPIQDQLAKLYPDDQATGFREGDLRGWFWVEVPK